jgi:hypothetical protein
VRTESVANDTSTLPDDVDADDEFDDELDLENLRVNFSTEEASSEGRDSFEALPSGRYPVVIFDGETRRVKDKVKGYFPKGSGGPAKWAKEPKKGGSSRSAGSISSGGESLLPG